VKAGRQCVLRVLAPERVGAALGPHVAPVRKATEDERHAMVELAVGVRPARHAVVREDGPALGGGHVWPDRPAVADVGLRLVDERAGRAAVVGGRERRGAVRVAGGRIGVLGHHCHGQRGEDGEDDNP
jgi:hypothetical protein